MELTEALEQYGLSEKQAKVYLAALGLGAAPVAKIAQKAGLKRPTVYLIIEELLREDLIIKVPQEKKIYYKATNPSALLKQAEDKKRVLENISDKLQVLYQRNSKEPKVRYYEGKDRLYKIYEEIFNSKEIWGIFKAEKYYQIFNEEDDRHFYRILSRAGGVLYDMFEDSKIARQMADLKFKKGLRESKLLPKDFKIDVDILVYGDKVAMFSLESLTAVIIEDKAIAESQRQLIKFLWSKI